MEQTYDDQKLIVLIVDDDAALRHCLREYLELEGFLVMNAANGVEAEELIRKKTPDCVLLDILMPEKDGLEVLFDFKNSGLKIIVMTGYGCYSNAALKFGANSVLQKPIDFKGLKKLIRT